jgi:hypothetical protein
MALTPPTLPATYSGDPLSSPTDEVRFLVGDTDTDNFYLSDAEINYCLVLVYGVSPPAVFPPIGNYLPAAYAADGIIAKLKMLVDESVGDLRVSYSKSQAQFQQVANRMRWRAAVAGVPFFVGGLSLAAKIAQYQNRNLLGTAVRTDGMDNVDTMNSNSNVGNNGGNGTGF